MFPHNCFSQIRVHGLNSLIENGLKIGLVGFGAASINVSNLKFFQLDPAPFNQIMKQPVLYTMPYPPGDQLVAHYVPHVSFDTATKNCKFHLIT